MSWSPAGTCRSTPHSYQAAAPGMSTPPFAVERHGTPAKRSPVRAPSRRPAASWCAPSTLMPMRGTVRSRGQVVDECATHTDTSGGSRDTGTNELAAMPTGSPATSPATTATPVGYAP
ncbi:hypothetical protein GCM10009546_10970 [Actinomadura livida]|uniref:Uncharacterized protein n=1 Tax=Actinomadura livida TaxID=79909 RepID=A0A7W7N1V8_9ACTN|nr:MULTISPECIES: hypothetical protein [Actinomadura]MBB4778564.1 hypothetical protein [Actinomadura catellatispora]GGU38254.1 hypothetical protein GCM10010208_73380 [Actinomadura livida]